MSIPRTALLIIDVQRDFCPPPEDEPDKTGWGALAINGGNDIVPIINKLRTSVNFDHVILSQDYHSRDQASFASRYNNMWPAMSQVKFTYDTGDTVPAQTLWPDHCVVGSKGVEFHPRLIHYRQTDIVVRKGKDPNVDSYSAFCDNLKNQDTALHSILTNLNVSRIVVVGLAYDYCVGFTAIDGRERNYDVIVCKDACRSVDTTDGESAMTERLTTNGIQVMNSDDYIQSVPQGNGNRCMQSVPRKQRITNIIPIPVVTLTHVNDIPLAQVDRFADHMIQGYNKGKRGKKTGMYPLPPSIANGMLSTLLSRATRVLSALQMTRLGMEMQGLTVGEVLFNADGLEPMETYVVTGKTNLSALE